MDPLPTNARATTEGRATVRMDMLNEEIAVGKRNFERYAAAEAAARAPGPMDDN